MELEQARKRAEELRVIEAEKNNRLYYDQDAPELEDFEYDAHDARAERPSRRPYPGTGHVPIVADPACGRHGQQQIQQGDPRGQDGEFTGCVLL